jgi:sterol desaturase/sphingolipid hydroxylase (fatty acid hydroxylase superfamily)
MAEWLAGAEGYVRFLLFAGLLVGLSILEARFPARVRVLPRVGRWFTNFLLMISSTLAVRLLIPLAAVGAAAVAERQGWGVFNFLHLPGIVEGVICIVLLDLAMYAQHRAFHAWPWLWRFHAVHHADPDLDATSGVRFHPIEAMMSMIWKGLVALILGAPVWAVLLFEVALNAFSLFTHANLAIPDKVERALRPWFITPAVHRLHHDRARPGPDTVNFGFSTAIWDRLFATFKTEPPPKELGIAAVAPMESIRPIKSLLMPFRPGPL